MAEHKIVSHDEWIAARKQFLTKEKEFTRVRDRLSEERRELPWERVDKTYVFEGPEGNEALPQLFDSCSQLTVYHFMFGPDWDAGCPLGGQFRQRNRAPQSSRCVDDRGVASTL
jgi:predicted dithiol-disulfide oxidoreductase (DUF899 family)